MSDIVSHNTELMRDWTGNLKNNTTVYDDLVNRMYTLIEQFAGSNDFKGGLSDEFVNVVLNRKQFFKDYSETFNECISVMNKTANKIDDDTNRLANMYNNNDF